MLLALAAKMCDYLRRVEDMPTLARVSLRRLEHFYHKSSAVYNAMKALTIAQQREQADNAEVRWLPCIAGACLLAGAVRQGLARDGWSQGSSARPALTCGALFDSAETSAWPCIRPRGHARGTSVSWKQQRHINPTTHTTHASMPCLQEALWSLAERACCSQHIPDQEDGIRHCGAHSVAVVFGLIVRVAACADDMHAARPASRVPAVQAGSRNQPAAGACLPNQPGSLQPASDAQFGPVGTRPQPWRGCRRSWLRTRRRTMT